MKDNAPTSIIIFFMVIVALVVIDSATSPTEQSQEVQIVETELQEQQNAPADLVITDEIE